MGVPSLRIQAINQAALQPEGDFVLYWMIAYRRTRWNFALQRAVEWASELQKPLVIFEGLRVAYPWASDRLHQFVIEGMRDNAAALLDKPVTYYPYLEPDADTGKGLLAALANHACIIVTDDFPAFMLPHMTAAAARQVQVLMEKVDSNGILPMRAANQVFPTAYAFRRFLQKTLPSHLAADQFPQLDPLTNIALPCLEKLPDEIIQRWPPVSTEVLENPHPYIARLPIDHRVAAVHYQGGAMMAENQMTDFVDERLSLYEEDRNEPQRHGTSGLSPYLHFGQLSVHHIFSEITAREVWSIAHLSPKATGERSGWWGMSSATESFLDELITWRELGFNMGWRRSDYDQYDSLPDWAKRTLADHADDPRDYVYTLEQFEQALTHDPLWNAAQGQLMQEGRIHNYLRMLWGKKILHWSASPQEALAIMIELNNKYAVDGRDPNSYSGIFWVLGRYDRAWGPERPIFGKIRYMTSENTARKYKVDNYIKKYMMA